MKKLFIILIMGIAAFFFWPVEPGSSLDNARESFYQQCSSVLTAVLETPPTEEDRAELLVRKQEELKAYEDVLVRINADIARRQADPGTCPVSGQPNHDHHDRSSSRGSGEDRQPAGRDQRTGEWIVEKILRNCKIFAVYFWKFTVIL